MNRSALALVAVLLSACSAGVGGDWPDPPKGVLADCVERGDRCGGSGYCGPTRGLELTCCPVSLDAEGYCPGAEAPGVVECVVDEDCPFFDCRDKAACVGGVCFAAKQAKPTICRTGYCTEDAECLPCQVDADCAAVNTNECYRLVCGENGGCAVGQKLDAGSACLQTPTGVCNDGAYCLQPQ